MSNSTVTNPQSPELSAFPQKHLPGQPPPQGSVHAQSATPPSTATPPSNNSQDGTVAKPSAPQPHPPTVHKRTYQACIPCRQRKVRCDLGSVEAPHDPPCVRCRREFKECYFSATRRKSRAGSVGVNARGRGGSSVLGRPSGRPLPSGDTETSAYGTPESETSSLLTPGSTISYGGVRKRQRIDSLGRSQDLPQEAAHLYGDYAAGEGYDALPRSQPLSRQYERDQEARTINTASTLLNGEVYNSHDALQLLFQAVGASTPAATNGNDILENSDGRRRRSSAYTDGDDHRARESSDPQIIFPEDPHEEHRHGSASTMAPSPRLRRALHASSRTAPLSPLAGRRPLQHPTGDLGKLADASGLREPGDEGAMSRALKAWSRSQFVKDGWFSAREAIAYVEYYITHLHPLSPILAPPPPLSAHPDLLMSEPFLLTVIVTIASRYMKLSGPGGTSRSYAIHDMLWKEVKRGFERLMWGGAPASTPHFPGTETWSQKNADSGIRRRRGLRTLGTLEALIVLTEWHVRCLHFPMELGGDWWGIAIPDDDEEDFRRNMGYKCEKIGDMLEPARRSDRMSWMLLGNALSLACELGVYDDSIKEEQNYDQLFYKKSLRVRKKLGVYILQLASRLGWTPPIPESLTSPELMMRHRNETPRWSTEGERDDIVFDYWAELTFLMKNGAEKLFSSRERTREIIKSGQYGPLLHECYPEMRNWKERFERLQLPSAIHNIMTLEYEHVRLFINSIALQAVVSRCTDTSTTANPRPPPSSSFAALMQIYSADVEFIKEVVDASRCVLTTVVEKMHPAGQLRHAPVRIFLRILSAAMFLLKTFALGAKEDDVAVSINLMKDTTNALRYAAVDDVHLAQHFADLLETLTKRIQDRFVRMPPDRTTGTPGPHATSSSRTNGQQSGQLNSQPNGQANGNNGNNMDLSNLIDNAHAHKNGEPHPIAQPQPHLMMPNNNIITTSFSSPPTPAFTTPMNGVTDFFYSPNEPAFDDWLAIPIDPILEGGYTGVGTGVYQNPMGLGVGLGVDVGGFEVDLLDVLLGMGEHNT